MGFIPFSFWGANNITTEGLTLYNSAASKDGSIWYDLSGNNNHGIISGSNMGFSGSFGWMFDGAYNYVTYPSNLVATPTNEYTLQFFGTLFLDGINRDLFCKESYADGWDTIFRGSNNDFVFRDTSPSDANLGTNVFTSSVKALYTITARSSDGLIQLYKNDVKLAETNKPVNSFTASSDPLVFGFNIDSDAFPFQGAVSDIVVYNRVLQQGEIANNYAYLSNVNYPIFPLAGSPKPYPISIGGNSVWNNQYSLTGSVWYDVSGNNNHALISGSTLINTGSIGYYFNSGNYLTYQSILNATPSSSMTIQYSIANFWNNPETNRPTILVKPSCTAGWSLRHLANSINVGGAPVTAPVFYFGCTLNTSYGLNIINTGSLYQYTNTVINGQQKLYRDGTLNASTGTEGFRGFNNSIEPLNFGSGSNGAQQFRGNLKNLMIYNRILSDTEIKLVDTFLNNWNGFSY